MPEPRGASAHAPYLGHLRRDIGQHPTSESLVRYAGRVVLLVAIYYAAAHLGYALDFAGPVAAIVWLPAGVGIAFLYLVGLEFWPGVVIGDLLVNNYSALPFGSALGQTTGNLLEVVVATVLLRRLAGGRSLNQDVSGVCRMLVAIAVGTAISATVGALSLRLGGVIPMGAVAKVWRTWWLGDFSGGLLVVPLAIAWFDTPESFEGRGWIERLAVGLLAVAGTSLIAWAPREPLTYVVFPALIWTAFLAGPRGATTGVAVAAGFAVSATTNFTGAFPTHSLSYGVLETQLFIAVASISTQCLAAVVSERRRFAERLWASRARLLRAADGERERLERNLHDGAQQRLAALGVRLDLASELVERSPAEARASLGAAREEVTAAIQDLRELAHGNHPSVLTERGLAEAILALAQRSPSVEVLSLPARRLPQAVEATAYYVIAEALANASRYAHGTRVTILAVVAGGRLHLEIGDDGVGGAAPSPGSGLEGLRDRVEALGGTLHVHSPRDGGTRVVVWLPEAAAVR